MKIVAFSGGKDSTAMAYLMKGRGEEFKLLHTPTGNELPEVARHVESTANRLGVELIVPKGPRLLPLIDTYGALPNHRQRWCTRQIKIEPCIAWLLRNPGCTLCVGLRSDEEEREGMYGRYCLYRYPLREMGWGVDNVLMYLRMLGVSVPKRTDCAWCYGQRLTEWFSLWRDHPDVYKQAEDIESRIGHTFRSPNRDRWPASLSELRSWFELGRSPRGQDKYDKNTACRVCKM